MYKLAFITLISFLVVLSSTLIYSVSSIVTRSNELGWFANGAPGFKFDCSNKEDGSYPHPSKCTHYVDCLAQKIAYERICARNIDGTLLHFVQWSGPSLHTSRCDYPSIAGCQEDNIKAGSKLNRSK